MRLRIRIKCDNAAFEDNFKEEICRCLTEAVSDMSHAPPHDMQGGGIRDSNGNKVGYWEIIQR